MTGRNQGRTTSPSAQHVSMLLLVVAPLPDVHLGSVGRSIEGAYRAGLGLPPAGQYSFMPSPTGVTQSRAERKQRRNFAAEAGETGDAFGDDMDEGTPPPGAKQTRLPLPPQTLEVSMPSLLSTHAF